MIRVKRSILRDQENSTEFSRFKKKNEKSVESISKIGDMNISLNLLKSINSIKSISINIDLIIREKPIKILPNESDKIDK